MAAKCGTLRVPEDRKRPQGRQISLRIAVIPALARTPAPDPLFLLAGGPGQGATEAFGPILGVFDRVRKSRDLVLVDQRGTGSSNPLRCELHPEGARLAEKLADEGLPEERFRRCLAGYDADPRFYTTAIAMQDLDEVRKALGYDQIDLWGGSYGTRAALVYLRDHGAHVRAVVLDGVAPYALKLPATMAKDGQRALDLLLDGCAKDVACGAAFPNLRPRFERLISSLEAEPARTRLADPVTGAISEVSIGRDAFASGIRGILYSPELAALVPLIVDRAARGDFAPFAAATTGFEEGFARTLSLGMFLSVVCTEDVPFIDLEEAARSARGTFVGPALTEQVARICKFWPRGELPPGARDPVRSDRPVLLLSGELDPVTPPAWAEEAKRTLPNSLHLVVPGVGHGATPQGCVPQLVAKFVEGASLQGLDGSCLQPLSRPPFFVSFAGPTP